MLEQSITYPPRLGYPFYITAKRYWLPEFELHCNDPDALTLVFLHSTSFHKETWEPTLSHLFKLVAQPGTTSPVVKVREAWAIDCPNHGESGVLNEEALKRPEHAHDFSCEKYAQAVHHFLTAGIDHGARVDFSRRKLVGVGHSLGANSILLLRRFRPSLNFVSMVIVEPLLSPTGPDDLASLRTILVGRAKRRNDTWTDRESAMNSLKKREQIKKWDQRVVDLFVAYALRPVTVSSTISSRGVTLACTRTQEIAMYMDNPGSTEPVKELDKACLAIPVHLIMGRIPNFVPLSVRQALTDTGRKYASVRIVDNVGHLIPQELPDKLGFLVFDALVSNVIGLRREKTSRM